VPHSENQLKIALNDYGPVVVTMAVPFDFFDLHGDVVYRVGSSYYCNVAASSCWVDPDPPHFNLCSFSGKEGLCYYCDSWWSSCVAGNHALLLVGYDNAGGYFICKNSWDKSWGNGGYIKIAYDQMANIVNFGATAIVFTGVTTPTYSISGTVSGATASGVTINLTGASTASTTTDNSGNYTISGLAIGTYTITPSKTGYTFAPASTSVTILGVNQTGKNFTATATYSISGTVTGATSVTVACTGQTSVTTSGAYTFNGLANGTYIVTPSKSGYTFSPTSTSVTILNASQTGKNFTATPITYSISGTVTGATSVTVACTGQTSVTTSGAYTFNGLSNGTYTVTASKPGYIFSPVNYSVTISGANITGKNFTATVAPYSISGTVSGAVASSVTMTLSGAASKTTATATDGTYSFTTLANGSYIVTPSKSGYTFSPTRIPVTILGANQTGKNFTATAGTYSISGYVYCANYGVAGVAITIGSKTATTSSSGFYRIIGLPNGTYTVGASCAGFVFTPTSQSVTISGQSATGKNFTMTCSSGKALALQSTIGGTISPSSPGSCYASGASVTLIATPGALYTFAGWTINGQTFTSNPKTITVGADKNVTATFKRPSGPIIIPPSLLSATTADKDSSGNYWVELIWEEEEAESLVYQVAYKLPSKFTYYYTPVVMADFQIDGSLVGSYLQVPSACDEYELMVRAYDPFTGAFSDWSNSQVATVVPTYPSPPTGVYNFCSDGNDTLVWAVDPNEACAYTDFKVYASTDGSSFGQLPLQVRPNGSNLYSLRTSRCPVSGTPSTYYKVSALIGENESASTMAVTLGEPPPPQKLGVYSTNLTQSDIKLADLSSDGLYDLVLQSAYLKANPDGTFTDESSKLNTTAGNGDRIRIFDMNGDGLLDRVISHKNTMWVEFNSSSGIFTKGPSVDLGGDIGDFAIGYIPLNISGNAKIAAGLKDKIALVELTSGSGFIVGNTVTTDLDVSSVALGDMNNDGLTDIVCGGKKGLRIFSATAYDPAVWNEEIVFTSSIISCVDIADANGDGFLDIAVGRQKKDDPLVYLFVPNYGDDPRVRPLAHTWQAGQLLDSLTLDNAREVVFADLEGRGCPGLVCVTEQAQQSCFLENDGAGNLRKTAIIFPGLVTAAAVGDFNSDGISDLATVSNKTIDIYSGMLAYDEPAETEGIDLPPQKAAFSDTTQKDGRLAIFWYDAMDDRTPPQSLTYEVVAGTADESRDLYQGEIGPNNTSCKPGNRLTSTTVSIPLQGHPGPTYWKVRAVDSCFNKGEWLKGITYSDGTTEIEQ